MQDKKIIFLVIALISIIAGLIIVLYKWLDGVYRNPESSSKLNIIGFTGVGVIETSILFILVMIYMTVS